MTSPSFLLKAFACLILLSAAQSAKILFMAHLMGKSHFNVFEPIVEELGNRNHDVTVHSVFQAKQHSNVKSIQMRPPQILDMLKFNVEDELRKGIIEQLYSFTPFATLSCDHLLTDDSTKDLVNKGKQFDVVIVDGLFPECAIGIASLLGKSTVYLHTSMIPQWMPSPGISPPSYVPNMIEPFTSIMSFPQRVKNAFDYVAMQVLSQYVLTPAQQAVLSKYFPQAPTVQEAHKEIAFHITNADPVIQSPRPSMPNIAHCGGMHCKDPKPLPKDLNDFVESSGEDGFIIFGLGSNVNAEMLSIEFQQAAVAAFGRLKQKVVWKFDGTLENLPPNVKTVDWMPQQDLLGHPKIRLFITHAGMLSLQETMFHGVPVIAMPLFAEQPGNAARLEELGVGETLDFLNLTADGLYQQITKILNDRSYKENMKKYSAVFRDQLERPVDRAAFWIEYVIRHNGARHLRSAGEDLNFFQYFLLDVIGFVVFLGISAAAVVVFLAKLSLKKFCSNKRVVKDNKKKKQ